MVKKPRKPRPVKADLDKGRSAKDSLGKAGLGQRNREKSSLNQGSIVDLDKKGLGEVIAGKTMGHTQATPLRETSQNSDRRGGVRANAGRPKGTGKYGEVTTVVRLPLSIMDGVERLLQQRLAIPMPRLGASIAEIATPLMSSSANENENEKYKIPLYESSVAAGFPSPATDYEEGRIDINAMLIKHPAATFLVRVQGDSMIGAGIHPNDILVVDRSLPASNGRIVIAVLNGELTVKRLQKERERVWLLPENDKYPPIEVNDNHQFTIWGVVTNVIHAV